MTKQNNLDLTRLIEKLDPRPDGQDKVQLRTGTVAAVNGDGTLDVTLSGVVVPDVPRLASVGALVGDAVQVQVYRGSMLVVGLAATQPTPNLASSTSINNSGPTSGQDDVAASAFEDMGGTGTLVSFSFTKRYADSKIQVSMHASCYCVNASPNNIIFGVRINAVDTPMFRIIVPNLNERRYSSGINNITGVPAGVYTVQGRWRRESGTGTGRRDSGDWFSMAATEVSG